MAGEKIERWVELRRQPSGEFSEEELSALKPRLEINGEKIALERYGNRFRLAWTPQQHGEVKARLSVRSQEGHTKGPEQRITILPDIRVVLPDKGDFGQVPAGCAVYSFCRPLDMGSSKNLDPGTALSIKRLTVSGKAGVQEAGWGPMHLVVRQDGEPPALLRLGPWQVVRSFDPTRPIEVCMLPPGCNRPPNDEVHEVVEVAPAAAAYHHTRHRARTYLVANVEPRPWLICNLWWILLLVGLLLAGVIIYGLISPHGFPQNARLVVADTERQLRRSDLRPLYSVPWGRRGFYRSATCCFNGVGMTVKRTTSHVLRLQAEGGSRIGLAPKGCSIWRKESRKWKPVDPSGHREDALRDSSLVSGQVYKVEADGTFYFRVDL